MSSAAPLPPEPMDPKLTTIQPGGGVVMRLELAWGALRRAYLRTFRAGYVRRMAALRKGDTNPCPFPVLDPRDLKFYRNQPGYHWEPQDDPFRWRDRIPFARAGLAELLVFTALTFGPAAALAAWLSTAGDGLLPALGWLLVAALWVAGVLVVWFFRDPERAVPTAPGLVISPADGKVVLIQELEYDEFVGGPAVQIGIFLSIFNCHLNRAPVAGRVVGLRYKMGKFLNAIRPESARENEQLAVRMQEDAPPYRRYVIRQITGAIARRIVCWLKPGDAVSRGERFGMIKFGSRTELVMPREAGLKIVTKLGDKVKAGLSVLAEYPS
ncbi:MAG: phosphatidylserine decarboxylase family protein [Gemmataceae bacterium]